MASVAHLIKQIPALRWRMVQQRYGVDFENIDNDPIVGLIIAANEVHRQANNGRDAYETFEAMPLPDLAAYVTQHTAGGQDDDEADAEAEAEADKSGPPMG
ncbi:hypothetical protein ACQCX5_14390 [Propionibacteriaceae bacterium G57]|uniref:hypothetical protein n=1 Tax=Aestuariimicrobium sp. G57 TaxID=3418485 RepID=UPI003DA71FEE